MGNHRWPLQSSLEHKYWPVSPESSYGSTHPHPRQQLSSNLQQRRLSQIFFFLKEIIEILSNGYDNSPKYFFFSLFFKLTVEAAHCLG